jgi:hypothetical protein
MSIKQEFTTDKIRGFYIILNSDIVYQWNPKGLRMTHFPVELLPCKENSIEGEYYQSSIKDHRVVSIKIDNYIFLLACDNVIQFLFMEALLDALAQNFLKTYQFILGSGIIASDNSLFMGFTNQIQPTFSAILKDGVKFVRGECKVCKCEYHVCIKNDLIEKATDFPVAVVYFHKGHGMLLYIDGNFKVRGVERVSING